MDFVIKAGIFFFRWRDTLFSLIFLVGLYLITLTNLRNWFGNLKEDIVFSIVGFILVIFGMFIRSLTVGFIYIKRAGINKKIHADQLFKEGLFAHSRNPLYLGNLFIVTGGIISINIDIFWFIVLPLFYFIYYAIIKAEEDFLEKKFKEEYIEFTKEVPRLWFGNFSKFPASFKNLNFSIKRVIKVEHSTQFLILLTISLINIFKFYFRYQFSKDHTLFIMIYIFMIILFIYQITSFYLKKKGLLN